MPYRFFPTEEFDRRFNIQNYRYIHNVRAAAVAIGQWCCDNDQDRISGRSMYRAVRTVAKHPRTARAHVALLLEWQILLEFDDGYFEVVEIAKAREKQQKRGRPLLYPPGYLSPRDNAPRRVCVQHALPNYSVKTPTISKAKRRSVHFKDNIKAGTTQQTAPQEQENKNHTAAFANENAAAVPTPPPAEFAPSPAAPPTPDVVPGGMISESMEKPAKTKKRIETCQDIAARCMVLNEAPAHQAWQAQLAARAAALEAEKLAKDRAARERAKALRHAQGATCTTPQPRKRPDGTVIGQQPPLPTCPPNTHDVKTCLTAMGVAQNDWITFNRLQDFMCKNRIEVYVLEAATYECKKRKDDPERGAIENPAGWLLQVLRAKQAKLEAWRKELGMPVTFADTRRAVPQSDHGEEGKEQAQAARSSAAAG